MSKKPRHRHSAAARSAKPAPARPAQTHDADALPPARPLPSFSPDRWFWILFAGAALIRIFWLGRHALYLDEVLNLLDARRSLSYIIGSTVHPLHFLLQRVFVSVSSAEWALRLSPALFSLFGMVVMFWIGRAELGPDRPAGRLPLILAALWAASQYVTFYSLDANYYAEMMAWSVLALWGSLIFLRYGRLWGGAVAIAAGAASMLVHPFSGLYAAPLIGLMALIALAGRGSRAVVFGSVRRSWRVHRGYFIAVLILAGGAGGFAALRYGGRLWGLARQFLREVKIASWAHNLDFNVYFFTSTFRGYGPSLITENAAAWAAAALVFALFAFGLWVLIRRQSLLALFIAAAFLITFIMIFNTGITRFYHIRYTSYLVPLYLIACGAGLAALGEWLDRRLATASRRSSALGTIAVAVVIVVLFVPFTLHLLFGPFANWKILQRHIAREFTPDSRLHMFFVFDHQISRYYLERAGRDPNQAIFPRLYHSHLRPLALPDLKRRLVQHPDSWFVSHWTEMGTTHPPLTEWVQGHFRHVADAPSRHEISLIQYYAPDKRHEQRESAPHQTARLYQWHYPGRFLYYPYDLEIPLRDIAAEAVDFVEGEYRFKLLVDLASTYTLELEAPAPLAGQATLAVQRGASPAVLSARDGRLAGDIWLDAGEQMLTLRPALDPLSPATDELTLRLSPSLAAGPVVIPPFAFDAIQPTIDLRVEPTADAPALGLRRNGFVRYTFFAPGDADYAITLNAIHDRPGPVFWGVWLDDSPLGLLAFDDDDNSAGAKTIRAAITRGRHTITLHFLNETPDDSAPADANRDGLIHALSIARADGTSGPDDRLPLVGQMLRPTPNYVDGIAALWPPGAAPRLNPNWIVNLDANSRAGHFELDGQQTVALDIAPQDRGALVAIPALPVNGARYVMGSFDVRCENLQNHSANLMLFYFNDAGEAIARRLVYTQGVHGDTDWVPMAVFAPIPEGTAAVSFGVNVYQNSRRPSPDPGRVLARRFSIHTLEP